MGATAVPVGPVTTVYVYLCSLVSATLFGWQLCHSSCSLFSYGFTRFALSSCLPCLVALMHSPMFFFFKNAFALHQHSLALQREWKHERMIGNRSVNKTLVLSIRKLYNLDEMNDLSGSRGKQGKLDVQRDPPVVDVEPCTGDEPVSGAVLGPHGHLRGVHEPEHLLRGDRHRRPAGEHAGVDVDDALRRLTRLLSRLLRSATATATTGRPRGGGNRQEAAGLPG